MSKAVYNGNQVAFPVPNDAAVNGDIGLTKREYFAGLMMQGFASDPACSGDIKIQAEYAVKWADALLAALEPQKQDN